MEFSSVTIAEIIFTMGYQEFAYVLKPKTKETQAFGSRDPRFGKEKPEVKKFKLKRKRYLLETKDEKPEQSTSEKKKIQPKKPQIKKDITPQTQIPVSLQEKVEVEQKDVTSTVSPESMDRSSESGVSLSSNKRKQLKVFDTPEEEKEYLEFKRQIKRYSVGGPPDDTLPTVEKKEQELASEKPREQELRKEPFVYPGPMDYHIKRFPEQTKLNKYPFNSTALFKPKDLHGNTPSPAAYKIELGEQIKGVNVQGSLGGPQTIILPTIIRCIPYSSNKCKRCHSEVPGDFYYSRAYGALCRHCFKNEVKENTSAPHVIQSYKRARHCGFMHYHDQYNIVREKSAAEVLRSLRREAYYAQFPDMTKMVKSINETEDTVAQWMLMCKKIHKPKREPLKLHPFEPEDAYDLQSLESWEVKMQGDLDRNELREAREDKDDDDKDSSSSSDSEDCEVCRGCIECVKGRRRNLSRKDEEEVEALLEQGQERKSKSADAYTEYDDDDYGSDDDSYDEDSDEDYYDEKEKEDNEEIIEDEIDKQVKRKHSSTEMKEEIMLAKEYQYLKNKGRDSIVPIFNVLCQDEDEEPGASQQASEDVKTDRQKELYRRFGSVASYYGAIIPEFREKGVLHQIDPDSDMFETTPKGRTYYEKTPRLFELSESDSKLRKGEEDEMEKKQKKIRKYVKQRKISTPPFPGPRLSQILKEEEELSQWLPLVSAAEESGNPIVTRNYDIPKNYWLDSD